MGTECLTTPQSNNGLSTRAALRLEPLTADHVIALTPFAGDSEITSGLGLEEEGSDWLTKWLCEKSRAFVILDQTGRSIGACGLFAQRAPDDTPCFLAYWIARPFQGRGYATSAVAALVRYANSDLGLRRVKALVRLNNRASISVLAKNGFCQWPSRTHDPGSDVVLYDRRIGVYP